MSATPLAACFSPDYTSARARFRASALALGCTTEAWSIDQKGPDGEELTIDMAMLGDPQPKRAVVVSSGLHGVEGFFGSAVQVALLEETLGGFSPPPGLAIVFLHALNPFGFAWVRRVNEDNADLNRNMLRPDEQYVGAPDGYAELDALLNPTTPPPAFEAFLPRAGVQILRHGMPALKNAVAGGQYEFPKGLFFGGHGPSRTAQILDAKLPPLIGACERVLHVDFHTGLGKSGTYKVFVDHGWGSEGAQGLARTFGEEYVQPWEPEQGESYEIRGGLGTWCKARFPEVDYDVLCAEFGTKHVLKVIRALRDENRAWHHGRRDDARSIKATTALKETFAPRDPNWRHGCVEQGLRIVEQAIDALA
ncbi:MAG: DUF2817 domain-containing protein [Deltaproteobacteria bacterium]|nr:MAG: DUF2817 domain-containing protein [Deltaproteobacteria bacterium]